MNGPVHQQHDLNPTLAAKLIADLRLDAQATVYEVGPGLGALTRPILASGAAVVAVKSIANAPLACVKPARMNSPAANYA